MRHQMDPESVILQTVFGEPSAASCWFMMNWALLRESGDVSLDTLLEQVRAAISAVALKKLLAEFYNRKMCIRDSHHTVHGISAG